MIIPTPDKVQPSIAVHGGAGTLSAAALDDSAAAEYHAGLRKALAAGWKILSASGLALDAVAAAVMCLEDDPLFNAARGAVFTAAGTLEMDAAIMCGKNRDAGAVAGICGPRNPILAARAVMEFSGTVMMSGSGAEDFLRAQKFEFMPPEYFFTQRRADALQLELARRAAGSPDTRSDADRHGTVGAVARDGFGNLAAASSTCGMTAKRPGRIGDTPIIGAGTFADNASCAISTTGTGEIFIRYTAAAEIAARIRHAGQNLERAANEVISELLTHGGDGGLIAIGATGLPMMPFNSTGMYRGYVGQDGVPHTAIHREGFS
jgi:beta-aspartyl-peptidase (threonine type)